MILCWLGFHKFRLWPYDPNAYPGLQCRRCGILPHEVKRK